MKNKERRNKKKVTYPLFTEMRDGWKCELADGRVGLGKKKMDAETAAYLANTRDVWGGK